MRSAVCFALFACALFAQPPDPNQLFQEAVAAQQQGNLDLAIRDYRRLLELRPDAVDAMANLGAALAHLGRFDEAAAQYRSALKLDPGNTAIRLNLGLAFYKKGDFRSAAAEFERSHQAQPHDARAATLLGDCYLKLNQPGKAVSLLAPLQKSNTGNLDLTYVLGSALIRSGKRREGAALVEQVARKGASADAYLLAGSTLLDLNEFEQARDDLEEALRLNPELPRIHTLAGIARDKLGDPAAAEPELRKAIDRDPSDFQANLYLGAILYKRRDIASARRYLERALQIDPSSAMARYELALVKSASGDLASAAADLEKIAREDPNWLEPHVELASLYYKLHRQSDGAKQREIVDRLSALQQQQGTSNVSR